MLDARVVREMCPKTPIARRDLRYRVRGFDSIEHMAAQWVAFRQAGVVEVLPWIVGHAKPPHYGSRSSVAGGGEGDDLL